METTIRKFQTSIGDVIVTKKDEKHYFVKFDKYSEPWSIENLAIKQAETIAKAINEQHPRINKNQSLTYYVLVKTIENKRCFFGWQYEFQIGVSEPWWRRGIGVDLCKKFYTKDEAQEVAKDFVDVVIIKVIDEEEK